MFALEVVGIEKMSEIVGKQPIMNIIIEFDAILAVIRNRHQLLIRQIHRNACQVMMDAIRGRFTVAAELAMRIDGLEKGKFH